MKGINMNKKINTEEKEKNMAKAIWLNYFNQYLYEQGVITHQEYCQMCEKISQKDKYARSYKPELFP